MKKIEQFNQSPNGGLQSESIKIIFEESDCIEFVFKNNEGKEATSTLSITRILELLINEASDELDRSHKCCDPSCAANGFCECGSEFEDYFLHQMQISIDNFKK